MDSTTGNRHKCPAETSTGHFCVIPSGRHANGVPWKKLGQAASESGLEPEVLHKTDKTARPAGLAKECIVKKRLIATTIAAGALVLGSAVLASASASAHYNPPAPMGSIVDVAVAASGGGTPDSNP